MKKKMKQATCDALRKGYQVCLESTEANDDEFLSKITSTVWSKIDCPEKHYLGNLKEHFDNFYAKYAADRNGTNADAVASDMRELANICSQMSTCCRAILGQLPTP